jgi:subtilase family serine protease|tara:strand:+ start:360 stop:956 length:597 start_codon:yes stop_codon:yes gene_type:complete
MSDQSISIVEFPELYNILKEIDDFFKFNLNNYEIFDDFINEIKASNPNRLKSTIITNTKSSKLFFQNQIDKNTILVLDELPIKIEKLTDKINTQLIKQRYNFQSKINIKNYILNFNSRIIANKENKLKLTEREIDIILFLNENKKPQSVDTLQKKVWGYSLDIETHTVETHVYRLRKKINDKFNDGEFIISHDEGYLI